MVMVSSLASSLSSSGGGRARYTSVEASLSHTHYCILAKILPVASRARAAPWPCSCCSPWSWRVDVLPIAAHRARHSRPLQPGTCVESKPHVLGLSERARSGVSAQMRASACAVGSRSIGCAWICLSACVSADGKQWRYWTRLL